MKQKAWTKKELKVLKELKENDVSFAMLSKAKWFCDKYFPGRSEASLNTKYYKVVV